MSERDELADKLMTLIRGGVAIGAAQGSVYHHMADAILAAGYRKPRTVTTAAELDALPIGAIVLDEASPSIRWYKGNPEGDWKEPSAQLPHRTALIDLPATVLYEGSAS